MSWIEVIDEDEAGGELGQIYAELSRRRGKLANVFKVQSLHPETLAPHGELYLELMFGESGLSRADRESIAVTVSAANNCAYCVNHHAEALARYEEDNARLRAIMSDFSFLDLPDRTARMLSYALKLTTSPSQVDAADIELLRDAGFSDRDILDINLVTAYYNFLNRIALGLGVTYSDEEVRGYADPDAD